jgi:competence protein ComEC
VPIRELWLARPPPDHPPGAGELQRLLADLAARGTRVTSPPVGTIWRQNGTSLTVLAPAPQEGIATADPILSDNDASLALRIDHAGRRLLFTGDLEEEGEELLLHARRPADLRADLVKVPHHGSRTSSTPALIAATAPRYAIISCATQNRFGFPHPDVLHRWRAAGARILRTDHHGTITATIHKDGRLEVTTKIR